jgi:hypothetical protein
MQPLTIKTLTDSATSYLQEHAQIEKYKNIFLVVGVSLVFASVIAALTPVLKAGFSGVVQYDTPTIASASALGGLGIVSLIVSLQKKYSPKQHKMPEELVGHEHAISQFYTVYDQSHMFNEGFVLALKNRGQAIQSMKKEEYKQFVLNLYMNHYDLVSGAFAAPLPIDQIKNNPYRQAVFNELQTVLDPRFIHHFN